MKYVPPLNSSQPDASYVNGNPATASQGSIPPAAAFENPMREIVNVISDSQQVPTDQDLHQVTRAIRDGKLIYCLDSGPLNTLQIASLSPSVLAYTPGLTLHVLVGHTVTGPTTISIGTLNPTAIKRRDGSELQANDMLAGQVATLCCDGTFFQLQNTGIGGTTGAGTTFRVDIPYVHDTGTTNALIGLYSPALPDINEGRTVEIKLANRVTGPTVFTPNNFPTHPVAHPDGSPIQDGDGVPNQIWLLVFDGVEWQLLDVYNSGGAVVPVQPSAYVGRSLQFMAPEQGGPGTYAMSSMPYLKRTPAVNSNRQVWTQSVFMKWSVVKTWLYFYTASYSWTEIMDMIGMSGGDSAASWGGGAGDFTGCYLAGSDQNLPSVSVFWAYGYAQVAGVGDPEAYGPMHAGFYTENSLGNDTKWHHVVFSADGAHLDIWVDGTLVCRGILPGPGGQMNSTINVTRQHVIGANANSIGFWAGCRARMAEFIFIDGQYLPWDKFAKVVNGSLVPIDIGTNLGLDFGTNGFYLNWQDSSACTPTTLGKDWSGKGNNWTPVNFSTTKVMTDFPGNPTS